MLWCDEWNTQGPLVEHCKNTLKSFYGDEPQASDSYARIINDHHFKYVTSSDSRLCVRVLYELNPWVNCTVLSCIIIRMAKLSSSLWSLAVATLT